MDTVKRIGTELGFKPETAREMYETFTKQGGLACVLRWPDEFSMFCERRNVLDILISAKDVR